MEFVINEWFCDYFNPLEPREKFEINQKFLSWFYASPHKLVILIDSPFHIKLQKYSKWISGYKDPKYYMLLKKFMSIITSNSSKIKFIEPQELHQDIINLLNREGTNYSSDQYLFEAALTSDSKIIVTTDGKLIDHMGISDHYRLVHLNDFLITYNI
jgi:predicted nucleic acid-binding protein